MVTVSVKGPGLEYSMVVTSSVKGRSGENGPSGLNGV